eukprot:scaffold21424_cov143-Isochrysis_galbana.AAC.4
MTPPLSHRPPRPAQQQLHGAPIPHARPSAACDNTSIGAIPGLLRSAWRRALASCTSCLYVRTKSVRTHARRHTPTVCVCVCGGVRQRRTPPNSTN